jgi:anti-sigma B factor antagonist
METHGGAPNPIAIGQRARNGTAIDGKPLLVRVEVSLYGDLDASNARDMEVELCRWVEANGGRKIVIDLGGLARIDSTGLAVLLRAVHHASQLGHGLGLRRPAGQVERMIALTGLDETLPFID